MSLRWDALSEKKRKLCACRTSCVGWRVANFAKKSHFKMSQRFIFTFHLFIYKWKATQPRLGLQIIGCPFSIHLINMPHALSAPNVETKHYKNVHFFFPHLMFFFVQQLPFPEFFFEAWKIPHFILCDALCYHFEVNRSGRFTVQPRQILATPTQRVSSTDRYLLIAT